MSLRIPGLTIVEDYLERTSEAALINQIDQNPWRHDLKRRTQHYGYRYDYSSRAASRGSYIGPLPAWIAPIVQRVKLAFAVPHTQDQVIVNEYQPGQDIAPHVDCPRSFRSPIISLSLGSGIEMEFKRGERIEQIYLQPRSLIMLQGAVRYDWTHAIRPRKNDLFAGHRIARQRRISITFRCLNNQS